MKCDDATTIDAADSERIYAIWDRLAEFDAARTEQAMLFLMEELKGLIQADDAVWVGVVRMAEGASARRDPQLGWRGCAVVHLEWTEQKRAVVAEAMKAQEIDGGVPSSLEMAKRAGKFRTLVLRELHEMATFTKTHHYRACFVPFDITDRLWCVFPVSEDVEVAYILDRVGNQPRFTTRDKALVSATLRGIKWFHRQTMLAHGVALGSNRLSPREKSVLAHLLSDRTEKEIAGELGLTPSTMRGYIKSVYAKYGVRGRSGLMALWLGRA